MTEPLLTARELGELLAFSPATMRLYFESISNERYQAERRVLGLWNIRWVLSDYEEAALRDDVHGMGETLRVLA